MKQNRLLLILFAITFFLMSANLMFAQSTPSIQSITQQPGAMEIQQPVQAPANLLQQNLQPSIEQGTGAPSNLYQLQQQLMKQGFEPKSNQTETTPPTVLEKEQKKQLEKPSSEKGKLEETQDDAMAEDFQTEDPSLLTKAGGKKLKLKRFGYNIFDSSTMFSPEKNVPVSPDYLLGPGDEIKVTVWGKIEGSWSSVIDRDGKITLPKIGTINVAGLTFQEMKDTIRKEFSKYYTGFEMNVTLGSLRTITVYIVGNVKNPGAYNISSLSTLVNALFVAGGPSNTGTMRDIQVKRNGKTIVHFDLYDFLLKGDKTNDIRLMPEDVIFIPPVGPLVGVAGGVKNPGIYELKGDTKISELIAMSGGLTATAYLQRVQLERVFENEVKVVLDTTLKAINKDSDIFLKDGDLLKIYPIINVLVNAITLTGNVTRPGLYQWWEGIRVSDIIKNPEKDLLPETYFDTAFIERYIPPDYHKELITFNLGKVLFDKDRNEDKELKPYDTITIYSKWHFLEKPLVRITGAVNKEGAYELKKGMKVSDLVKLAGGPKYYAYLETAELTRVTPTKEGPKTEKIILNLEKALQNDPNHDIELQQDDYLFVRVVPEWDLYKQVTIKGEVKFPGVYTIRKGERLSSLIERAGGFTDKAYLEGAVFIRQRVRELQQKSINEMVDRLERELLSTGTAEVAVALSPEDAKIKEVEIRQKRDFINRLRNVKALGRIAIKIDIPERLKNTEDDLELEDNDIIEIPQNPKTIFVVGSVYNQNAFVFKEREGVDYYLNLAGGLTANADESAIYILKTNGTAERVKKGFFGLGQTTKLMPGDTIVVPEKLERIAWMKNIKDITQILYQIAVTAGVLIVAF